MEYPIKTPNLFYKSILEPCNIREVFTMDENHNSNNNIANNNNRISNRYLLILGVRIKSGLIFNIDLDRRRSPSSNYFLLNSILNLI